MKRMYATLLTAAQSAVLSLAAFALCAPNNVRGDIVDNCPTTGYSCKTYHTCPTATFCVAQSMNCQLTSQYWQYTMAYAEYMCKNLNGPGTVVCTRCSSPVQAGCCNSQTGPVVCPVVCLSTGS
jgi:hypothetical protein